MKRYIGDGVYVEHDGMGGVTLTTENGIETTNTIVLEACVLEQLEAYIKEQRP